MSSNDKKISPEQRLRQAFERLKAGKPEVLKPGAPVTQNNVAREAGYDPSALRKARFPSLVAEIQLYGEAHHQESPSKRQVRKNQQKTREEFQMRLNEIESQRDHAQSQLNSAHRRILDLSNEIRMLRARLDDLSPAPVPLNGKRRREVS